MHARPGSEAVSAAVDRPKPWEAAGTTAAEQPPPFLASTAPPQRALSEAAGSTPGSASVASSSWTPPPLPRPTISTASQGEAAAGTPSGSGLARAPSLRASVVTSDGLP